MKHYLVLLFLCILVAIPELALAEEVEITLVPGVPARPVPLAPGVSLDDLRLAVVDLDLEAGAAPRRRTFTFAGRALPVMPAIATAPYQVSTVRVGGRPYLLARAERYVGAGRVRSVTLRLAIDAGSGLRPPPVPEGWAEALPDPDPVLAIVTTRIIAQRSDRLDQYVRWRESQGFTVFVGTEADWDVESEVEPDGRAERIRAWLRSVRDEHGLGYVLLIGDPSPNGRDGVPMKLTHPLNAVVGTYPYELQDHIDPVPTDHYYSDLDGNWDLDEDGRFGVYPLDRGPNSINWEPDALVGRLPVYWDNADQLDEILEAIMAFEANPDPGYRHRVLLPAAFIGFEGSPTITGGTYRRTIDGAGALEQIHAVAPSLDPEVELIRFYEEDGLISSELPHERPLDNWELIREWTDGAGLVVAVGHGSPEGIYRAVWMGDHDGNGNPDGGEIFSEPFLSSWDVGELWDTPPGFVFLSTCEAGWPEFFENLGFATLANGSLATVASSRIAVGSGGDFEPDPGFGDADTLAYTFAYLVLEGMTAGAAMAYLRYGLPADDWGYQGGYPMNGYGWLGKLEFNLYGDPLLSLGRCEDDEACAAATACQSSGRCAQGFCVYDEPPVDCSALDSECTVGRCDPDTGECRAEPVPDGTDCDDGQYCTEGDTCAEGVCVAGEPRVCDPRSGYTVTCSEEADDCRYEPLDDPDPDPGDPDDPELFGSAGDCQGCRTAPRPAAPWLWRLCLGWLGTGSLDGPSE